MIRKTRRLALAASVAALALAATAGGWWYHNLLPRRFAPVVAGHLYRSGTVKPAQLERLRAGYGIRRVVSLLNPEAEVSRAEREAAARAGIEWENVPLTGDGASTPADRARILALLSAANAPPTLVHCAAGVNRTGLAVGLFRLHVQHWPLENVLAELKQFGFEDQPQHENLRAALVAEAAAASDPLKK
jgi:protein tyrosine/serine phosphatase